MYNCDLETRYVLFTPVQFFSAIFAEIYIPVQTFKNPPEGSTRLRSHGALFRHVLHQTTSHRVDIVQASLRILIYSESETDMLILSV